MTRVLLLASAPPAKLALARAVRRFHASGARVDALLYDDWRRQISHIPLDSVQVLSARRGLHPGETPARRLSPAWVRIVARNLGLAMSQRLRKPTAGLWVRLRHDPAAAGLAAAADVLVALDSHAIYAVWRLSHRRGGLPGFNGLDAAIRLVEASAGASAR